MANVDINFKESLILNKALLATVERLEKEAEQAEIENFDKKVSSSLLKQFLLDNHPELTSELAEFTMAYVQENGYEKDNIAGAGLEALSYHDDAYADEGLKDESLKGIVKKLKEIASKNKKVG